ncbi:MAG: hypothetical protein ABWZ91_17100, partial [Nocardioides sp.]
ANLIEDNLVPSQEFASGGSLCADEAAAVGLRAPTLENHRIGCPGGSATVVSYDGNTRSMRNVGWEVRGVTTHKFSFYLASVTKCMQVRGGATGLYSRSLTCES